MTVKPSTGPLAGLKVIDFGQFIAGPGAAMMLADQGADVVRIEMPGGPRMQTPANAVLNRGKRIRTLDLKDVSQFEIARELVATSDVVIENFRPGVMARLGLGPEAMTRLNPRLVYLSLPGFSREDEANAGIPAWEGVIAAAMGQFTDMGLNRILMGIEASYSPLTLASAYASVFGAMAVVLALRARELHGVGDVVEVPLAAALMEGLAYNSLRVEPMPERYKSLREREIERRREAKLPMNLAYGELQPLLDPFYRSYRCKDGRPFYVVSVSHIAHSERALKVLGLWDEMVAAGLPRFDPYPSSHTWKAGADCTIKAHPMTEPWAGRLASRMAEAFLTKDSTEWERLFGEAGAPAAAHRTTREWIHSDHPRKAGLIQEIEDRHFGMMLQPGPIAWLAECPPAIGSRPASEDKAAEPPEAPARTSPTAGAVGAPWLNGVTILDMTNVIAGPTIAGTLARFGARVIKIDAALPTFDPWNTVVMGLYANLGKESALVDAKSPKGREIIEALIAKADILTINATEQQLAALRLDLPTLRRINPRIVLCQLDAFGGPQKGPRSDHLGYDDLVQASTGVMERFGGSLETVEEHAHFGTIDVMGGIAGAFAASLALLRRETTGQGDAARTSLAAAGQWLQSRFMFDYDGRPPFDEPRGRDAKGEGPLYRCYKALDRWFFLAARNTASSTLERSELLQAAAGLDSSEREAWLERTFATKPLAFWIDHLAATDLAMQPLDAMSDVRRRSIADHDDARTIVFDRDEHHPSGHIVERIRQVAVKPKTARLLSLAPAEKFGHSTTRLMEEIGYSAAEIAEMLASGMISTSWSDFYLPD